MNKDGLKECNAGYNIQLVPGLVCSKCYDSIVETKNKGSLLAAKDIRNKYKES